MRTNIEIDNDLIAEVMKKGGLKTKRDAVHTALKEYLRLIKLHELSALAGKINWEGDLTEMRKLR